MIEISNRQKPALTDVAVAFNRDEFDAQEWEELSRLVARKRRIICTPDALPDTTDFGKQPSLVRAAKAFEQPLQPSPCSPTQLLEYVQALALESDPVLSVTALTQSSGWGKSRLLVEMAKRHYAFYLALRMGPTQYPPVTKWGDLLEITLMKASDSLQEREILVSLFLDEWLSQFLTYLKSAPEPSPEDWLRICFAPPDKTASSQINIGSWSLSEVQSRLITRRTEIAEILNDPKFCIVVIFDEASCLLKSTNETLNFRAVRRVFGLGRFAAIFSSTNSKVQNFVPALHADSSARSAAALPFLSPPIWWVGPFASGPPFDLSLTFAATKSIQHLASYGRPLWGALFKADPISAEGNLLALASYKLLGTLPFSEAVAKDSVCLAVCSCIALVSIAPSVHIAESLVHSNMATLVGVSSDRELLKLTYPAEPMLAITALYTFLGEPSQFVTKLVASIGTGLVDQGQTGELFVRLALLSHRQYCKGLPGNPHQSLSSFIFNVCPSLQVPPEFEAGFINFTHFTRIGRPLDASAIRLSLQRQAAIVPQLANQTGYDIVIPIFLGDEDDVIHDSNVGALVIQVKFRVDGGNPNALHAAMRRALPQDIRSRCWTLLIQQTKQVSDAHPASISFEQITENSAAKDPLLSLLTTVKYAPESCISKSQLARMHMNPDMIYEWHQGLCYADIHKPNSKVVEL